MGKNNSKKKPRTDVARMDSLFAKLDHSIKKASELAKEKKRKAEEEK